MTKTPIDDFPAGPLLDAEVARILGWTELRKMENCDDWKGKPPGGPWYVIPRYSVDIGAAWRLDEIAREKLDRCWVYITNVMLGPEYKEEGFSVIFHECGKPLSHKPSIYGHSEGQTLPLAITRAFLKSQGVEEVEVKDE